MNNIINSTKEIRIRSISSALRSQGVGTIVKSVGVTPNGEPIYAVVVPLATEAARARDLLYHDSQFLLEMSPELANYIRGIRSDNLIQFGQILQSKLMYKLSVFAFIAILIGYFLGF